MSSVQSLTLLIGLQIALYGLGWTLAARYVLRERAELTSFSGFAAFTSLGLALIALRGQLPDSLTGGGSNLCILAGFTCMWRGALQFSGLGGLGPIQRALGWIGAVTICWFTWVEPNLLMRVTSLHVVVIASLLWTPVRVFAGIRAEFGLAPAWTFWLAGWGTGAALLVRTFNAWVFGRPITLDVTSPDNVVINFILLIGAALLNMGLVFVVGSRLLSQLQHLSTHDSLTGLLNRGAWLALLQRERDRQRRYGGALAVLAFDVDHFKSINDEFGHAAGDQVPSQLAAALPTALRQTDRVGRIGGEEFAALLVGADAAAATQLAERVRTCVESQTWPESLGGRQVTVSIGVSLVLVADPDPAAALARADAALYRAKHAGRNCVAVAT